MNRIDRFLRLMNDRGASDFHFTVGRPPMLRVSGVMERIRYRTIQQGEWDEMLEAITPPERWTSYKETGDTDFAYQLDDVARFRVNLFRQHRGSAAVMRIIPSRIMTIEQLSLPPQVRRLAEVVSGLVLVTGPTGSGKSTTLAALIDSINSSRKLHIVTLEDPIEFIHPHRNCVINQREVGSHVSSFGEALKASGREDPDVILVGEMRDLETVSMALDAAGKGALVFGTLHTNNVVKAIDRMVNVFPPGEQDGVRYLLADCLQAVVAQQLLPKIGGGRVAAVELLFCSSSIGAMIRENKMSQVVSAIQTGVKEGMMEMDTSIRRLFEEGVVDARAAYDKAINKDMFKDLVDEVEGDFG
jgi:twitching motility protein PilT